MPDIALTHGELFAGIGGFGCAFGKSGIETKWHVEIDKSCQSVLRRHFPDTQIEADVCEVGKHNLDYVDVITFGSPCFPADTLILTEYGYKPIQEIVPGDKVATHKGRWRSVLKTGNSTSSTVLVSGQGHYGIESTPNHPFWGMDTIKYYPTKTNGKRTIMRLMGEPNWIPAKKMQGKRLALLRKIDSLPVPPIPHLSGGSNTPKMDDDFWWMIGRWLGDGWVMNGQRSQRPVGETKDQVFLCSSRKESDGLLERLRRVSNTWMPIEDRTVIKFRWFHKGMVQWLVGNFGKGAAGKHLPSWVFGLPENSRAQILSGYMSADGWEFNENIFKATTISRSLALGIRMLAETLCYTTSLYKVLVPDKTIIEGRVVSQNTQYQIVIRKNGLRSNALKGHGCAWYSVKNVVCAREAVTVYNLEIDEDNTYIAEGIVVHNCQDLSIAGKRKGFQDGTRSNLFFEAVRIIQELNPRFAIWENVPGALSSRGGRDFQAAIESLLDASIPMPKSGRWATAGMVRTGQKEIAWRCLDAQYFNVPQRRRRIFLVFCPRGNSASEILFESEGGPRNTPPGRETGKEVAYTLRTNAGSSSGKGDGGINTTLIADIAPTLRSGIGGTVSAGRDAIVADIAPTLDAGYFKKRYNDQQFFSQNGDAFPVIFQQNERDEIRLIQGDGQIAGVLQAQPGMKQQNYLAYCLNSKNNRYDGESQTFLAFGWNKSSSQTMKVSDTTDALQASSTSNPAIFVSDFAQITSKEHKSKPGEISQPLNTLGQMTIWHNYQQDGSIRMQDNGTVPTVPHAWGAGGNNVPFVGVRRLTPKEAERLQGFPDSYTLWGVDTNGERVEQSDSARYKQLGNAVAVPVVEWIASRIVKAETRLST